MELAKPRVDIGLATNRLAPVLAFWQGEVGLSRDHVLPIRRGQDQHRHDVLGSVLKINHHLAPLPDNPPSGYRELVIAREGLTAPWSGADPDGAKVSLVPPGHDGVTQIGVRIAVRDLAAHRRFYAEALGLPEERPGAFRAGESLILLEESADAPADAQMQGTGWRYITFQVFKVDATHASVLAKGGREALAPVTLGSTARISMVRDPDGNWIELSQRASIVGSLEKDTPMELILIRHGLPERSGETSDPPLSEEGHDQARRVAATLARERIDAVFASTMRRAIQTAEPYAAIAGHSINTHDGIVEFDRDSGSYVPLEVLKREDYAAWTAFVQGGGDTDIAGFQRTVVETLEEVIRSHRGGTVAVFCHGGVINVWTAHVLGMTPRLFFEPRYTSVHRYLCASSGQRNLVSLNEVSHLSDR